MNIMILSFYPINLVIEYNFIRLLYEQSVYSSKPNK